MIFVVIPFCTGRRYPGQAGFDENGLECSNGSYQNGGKHIGRKQVPLDKFLQVAFPFLELQLLPELIGNFLDRSQLDYGIIEEVPEGEPIEIGNFAMLRSMLGDLKQYNDMLVEIIRHDWIGRTWDVRVISDANLRAVNPFVLRQVARDNFTCMRIGEMSCPCKELR